LNGKCLFINRAALAMMGYAEEEIVGKFMHEVCSCRRFDGEAPVAYEDCPSFKAMRQGGEVRAEVSLSRKDGNFFPISCKAFPIMEKSEVKGALVSFTDITERKKTEEALRQSQQIVERAPIALYIASYPDGKILWANQALYDQSGYSPEDLKDKSVLSILTPESQQFFVNRVMKMLAGEKVPDCAEFEGIRKSGEHGWARLQININYKDGKPASALVAAIDITELKRAEAELRKSEERFRQVAEQSYDLIWEVDACGLYTYASPGCQAITGFTAEEIIGKKHFYDLHPAEGREEFKRAAFEVFKTKGVFREFPNPVETRDGRLVMILTNGQPILDERGELVGYRGSDKDDTERRKAEREKLVLAERLHRAEKMEALGTLAGGVAHDLNNVLGVVVGYSELLLSAASELTQEKKKHLSNIVNGAQRAGDIVQDMLTMARRGVNNHRTLNLNQIILDCERSYFAKLYSEHPAVRIKTELDAKLLNISGSAVHLGKVLFNLVANACEAMKSGGLLTIKTANQYLDRPFSGYDKIEEGDYVVLSVSDTGEGISEKDLKHIFEPFYTKKVMGRSGTGLGLAVVWGTVKDHRGYINVQSQEGQGSSFNLYFPVSREEIANDKEEIPVSLYQGKGESILVVDDVEEQRDLASSLLRTLGYSVASVSSGEKAIEYLKRNEIDILVLDMIMDPGLDGLDTYRLAVKIKPGQKAVIVSGFSETERVKQAQALGAGVYVKKPYIRETLGLAVRRELDH